MNELEQENVMRALGMLSAAWLLSGVVAMAGESVDRTIEVSADVDVEIENIAGSVEVEVWERSQVRVVAELGDDTEGLEIESEGGELRIEVEIPEHSGRRRRNWDINSEIKLWVPRRASVGVDTVSASIDVRDIGGSLDLETVSGSIEATGSPVDAELATVSGNIDFEGSASAVDVETVSGRVRLKGVSRRVDVSTVSGSVTVDASEIDRADIESVSGSIEFRGDLSGGARVDFSSHSGNVELLLPAGTAASFEVETFAGSIRSDFGGEVRRTSRYAPGSELYHSTGNDAKVSVETFSGNVYLVKD